MEPGNGRSCAQSFLAGVVAYVDVWSSSRTENYSETFAQQLFDMGAKVSKTFNKQVTHVIFKDGRSSTWNRAQKSGVKLVSVLWVEKCREVGAHVDESLYPAINTNEGLPQLIKKHKCMQPKDFIEKTPENDRRLQKRLEIMAKNLDVQKAATETDIPVLLFEDDGSLVYSPASKIKFQCSAMERRIKDMKEKRENLSPTASQMSQVSDSNSAPATCEPTLVSMSSACTLSSDGPGRDSLNSSFTNMLGNPESKRFRKKSGKYVIETENATDVSTVAFGSSPVSIGDSRHLRRKLIQLNNLEDDFCAKSVTSEMCSAQSDSFRNDWFMVGTGKLLSEANNLGYRFSSEKSIHLEAAEGTNDSLNSGKGCSSDPSSVNVALSPLTTDCASSCEQPRKTIRSSIGWSSSPLCERDLENDFLQAILAPTESTNDQDSSYEDYFSPANFNKNKVRISLPLQCLQKSQCLPDIVCKCSPSQSQQGTMQQESHKKGTTCSKKRKRVSETVASLTTPQSKKRATLNCTSQRAKGEIVEAPFLNHNFQIQICTSSVNRCNPSTGDNTLCGISDHSCEVFLDQRNEPNENLKTTRRIKKPLRTLVMTSMSSEKQNAVVQVVRKLGGFQFSNEVCKNTSHVVAGSPRRTLSVLMGIARGCWIVCFEWVLWSLEYGHWISEEPYELSVDFPAAPVCRIQRYISDKKYHQKLFSDQPLMFVSRTTQPPCEKLCELIQLCGGKVCKTPRRAKVCIGECKVGKYAEIKCLSEKWILDSITQHKICPPENYFIFQNKHT
ncbi:microcephalin [Tiliqua scincoides]|uniref:microcephalin n=1 Tax=Tiliqua scincoides TaxID=71010 RepID=UPI003463275D